MNPTDSPWQLVSAGRYAEAAEACSQQLAAGEDLPVRRERASALLLAGRAAEAMDDFRAVIDGTTPNLRGDGDYLRLGVCHWHLDQPAEAVAVWRESLSAPYTDAAGGVTRLLFLLYAGARLNDNRLTAEAGGLLHERWRGHARRTERGPAWTERQRHEDFVHPGLVAWPGVVIPFLLGMFTTVELDASAASSPVEILRLRHGCQADVAVAVRALREGNPDHFQDRMTRAAACTRYGPLEEEFLLARWEVENGFPTVGRRTPSLFD